MRIICATYLTALLTRQATGPSPPSPNPILRAKASGPDPDPDPYTDPGTEACELDREGWGWGGLRRASLCSPTTLLASRATAPCTHPPPPPPSHLTTAVNTRRHLTTTSRRPPSAGGLFVSLDSAYSPLRPRRRLRTLRRPCAAASAGW
ncbi:hypothetical protein B484DRAFT_460312 [Ochromonadaceae sp. CCMP2298]|nr:hypothetical protein B484DRAFT_460312 [Ochromonadaceae sp. CCMP2298]